MNSNAVDSFTLPTEGFDRPLLPEEARVVGSQFFRYQEVEQFIEENFASGSPLPPTGGES